MTFLGKILITFSTPDGFTQPSADESQMVQGMPAPSDVKPPVSAAPPTTAPPQPIEKGKSAQLSFFLGALNGRLIFGA